MESWSKFRRGLRKEDQDALDELFRAARLQLASSAYAARPIPFESIAMSMLVMQQRTIQELRERIGRLERVDVRHAGQSPDSLLNRADATEEEVRNAAMQQDFGLVATGKRGAE